MPTCTMLKLNVNMQTIYKQTDDNKGWGTNFSDLLYLPFYDFVVCSIILRVTWFKS